MSEIIGLSGEIVFNEGTGVDKSRKIKAGGWLGYGHRKDKPIFV